MLTVNFFASIREQLGLDLITIENALPATVDKLLDRLISENGDKWQQVLREGRVLVAVNQVVGDMNSPLKDGDEVAFFPPVTGG